MAQAELVLETAQERTITVQVVASPLPPSVPPPAPPHQRLLSLDALRGFTMFWIIGGSEVVIAITGYIHPPLADPVETQLYHAKWNGFTVLDLVMPLFLFVVGAAMPLALTKRVEPGQSLGPVYWRIARRVAALWLLGVIYQFLRQLADDRPFITLELYSNTLQAIAVGYLVASLALLHLRVAGQIVLTVALILGYWALLVFVPFGGHPAGTLERTANFARYVDENVLDVFRRDHSFTWVVTSLGFSASVLMGAMAGHLLKARLAAPRRLLFLVLLGLGCLAGGWIWSYSHPLNRHLWTSSMILWAGGWSFLLLALFHAVIDVARVRGWAYPFIVIGTNALLAYVLVPLLDWRISWFKKWVLPADVPAPYVDLLAPTCEVVVLWLFLWLLYRRQWFLRA